jgi:periplasmic protein CpxP/Spy
MNLKNSRGALLALGIGMGLALGLIPAVSGAQTAPRQLPANPQADQAPPPPAQSNRADPRGFDRRANRFDDRLDRRLDFLHSELRITPAQEQVWATFADAVRREAREGRDQYFDRPGRDAFRGGPDGRYERPGIVERLERRQQGLEERGAYYDRLLSALRPLYAALSDDQKRAADENLFNPGRDDRGPRGWRRYGFDRDYDRFGRGGYRGFERPGGPFDPPYYSWEGPYR